MTIMTKFVSAAATCLALISAQAAMAESLPTAGALVIVPAYGEVKHANDQAVAMLAIEEQDKDKSAAASRVNQKMKQGMEIVRQADPQASLKTQGYYTYAVYADTAPGGVARQPRVPVSWRVGQYLEVTTTNLNNLPKTVAAAQHVLTLNGLQFGLTPETAKKLDDQRIAATYQNLNERVAAIARAMGRPLAEATLDTVDFEGSGNYAQPNPEQRPRIMASAMMARQEQPVAEPSFEPGETTLEMRLVGKVRFK